MIETVHAGRSLLAILDEQHAQLLDLPYGDVLVAEATRHLAAEAQYLYPAVRRVLPDGTALADRELRRARELRAALRSGVDVDRALRRHVAGCAELFPALREHLDEVAQIRLGNRVEIALEAAPTRPHPWAPDRPPLNKWVDPLVGVADKVRDALTGRATYPGDMR